MVLTKVQGKASVNRYLNKDLSERGDLVMPIAGFSCLNALSL